MKAPAEPTSKPAPYGGSEQSKLSVMRVNQLDAGVLDTELHQLLRTQLVRACSGLPAGTLERFKPEVDALFNLLMFRFTVWIQRPTPGMHLQGLRYRNEATARASAFPGTPVQSASASEGHTEAGAGVHEPTRSQRLVHGLLSVAVQWAFARLRRHALVRGWSGEDAGSARRIIWHVLRRLETLFRMAWLINLLLFLRHGKYATLVDRVVQMRMVHDRVAPAPRSINYQFLNRRLLWDHWAQMAYVVTPLLNWASIRRAVAGGAARLRREVQTLGIVGGGRRASGGGRGTSGGNTGDVFRLSGGGRAEGSSSAPIDDPTASACAECGTAPAKTPYVTGCGHVFCYYCARVACTVDSRYACPRCGEYFATSRRWSQPR